MLAPVASSSKLSTDTSNDGWSPGSIVGASPIESPCTGLPLAYSSANINTVALAITEAGRISPLIAISIGAMVDAPLSSFSAVVTGGLESATSKVPSASLAAVVVLSFWKIKSLGMGRADVPGLNIGHTEPSGGVGTFGTAGCWLRPCWAPALLWSTILSSSRQPVRVIADAIARPKILFLYIDRTFPKLFSILSRKTYASFGAAEKATMPQRAEFMLLLDARLNVDRKPNFVEFFSPISGSWNVGLVVKC